MRDGLTGIWSQLAHPKILVVGDLILDRYIRGDVERISPEAPIPVLRVTHQETRLGGAASVANNLAVLEADVTCCGSLGDDEPARQFRQLLDARGIDDAGVVIDESRRTTVKTRMIAHVQHVLRVDEEDTSPVGDKVRAKIIDFLKKNVAGFDIVLVSDYAKGLITTPLMEHVVNICRKAGKRVLVDPARIEDYSLYRGVSVITPNRAETELATGMKIPPEGPTDAAKKLLDELDLRAVVVTLDRDGMALCERDGKFRMFPTKTRAVYDVTGAGDMVLSVLGLTLAAGGSFADAIGLANVAGGLEVERIGAAPLTRKEIATVLAGEHALPTEKIKTPSELIDALQERRRRKQTVVFTNGCFDVLHIGHLKSLEAARGFGDVLVVGLNSDASVRKLKGPERPIYNQDERAEILAALGDVTYVTIFDDDTPLELIKTVKPDVLVKGSDWQGKGVVGQDFVESYGGRVELIDLVTSVSTTDIITRVLSKNRDNNAK